MKRGVVLLKKYGWIIPVGILVVAGAFVAWYLHGRPVAITQPAGTVGIKERNLMLLALTLSVIVVVPVFIMAGLIAWRYREQNPRPAKYQPEWDHSRLFEGIWWGIPIVIIGILSVVTWNSSHALDPYRSLDGQSDVSALHIQVVALDWKWLFIYPDQHIASVNLAEIPTGQQVDFEVTSDTIMNSFWVPALGGQIYAMPGMSTHLHEQVDKPGEYLGSPANIAGHGFARMDFTVRAASKQQFDNWVIEARQANRNLTDETYKQLAKPSDSVPVGYYSWVNDGLFSDVVMKYMMPMADSNVANGASNDTMNMDMSGMDMSGGMQ